MVKGLTRRVSRRVSIAPRDMDESPFSAILGAFVERVPGALAAALVDEGGETVDYAGKYDLFELKVMAAHFRILLGAAGPLLGSSSSPGTMLVRGKKCSVLTLSAPEGYAVVVVMRKGAGFARRDIASSLMMADLSREAGWAPVSSGVVAPRWDSVDVRWDAKGRPVEILFEGKAPLSLEVLGTFGRRGFRVRAEGGHEFSLVREPKNQWYSDAPVAPAL